MVGESRAGVMGVIGEGVGAKFEDLAESVGSRESRLLVDSADCCGLSAWHDSSSGSSFMGDFIGIGSSEKPFKYRSITSSTLISPSSAEVSKRSVIELDLVTILLLSVAETGSVLEVPVTED